MKNFFSGFLRQFLDAGNLAPILAEQAVGALIILAGLGLAWMMRRRALARGKVRGSLSGDLFLPIRRRDGTVLFANRTVLMEALADLIPDEGLVAHLFSVFRRMERRGKAEIGLGGARFGVGVVQIALPGVYWGVLAMLVKHLSAAHGETFVEMAAQARAKGAPEGAETEFVMALVYQKATRNWFPRLLLAQKDFLLSLPERSEVEFSFAFPPHAADLRTLTELARLYATCDGDQAVLAEHGLMVATVSLPTEEG